MKKILLITLIAVSSFVVNAQRDTINYFPFQLKIVINDTNVKPTGLMNDSMYIDTYIDDIDSIFKAYKVVKLFRAHPGYNPPPYQLLDSIYILFCKTDEYALMNTLLFYDSTHYHSIFRHVDRIPWGGVDVKGNDKIETYNSYLIYPNPSTGMFVINCNSALSSIEVYNLTGELLYTNYNLKRQTSLDIDLSDLQKGIYFVRIQDGMKVTTEKIIIQ